MEVTGAESMAVEVFVKKWNVKTYLVREKNRNILEVKEGVPGNSDILPFHSQYPECRTRTPHGQKTFGLRTLVHHEMSHSRESSALFFQPTSQES